MEPMTLNIDKYLNHPLTPNEYVEIIPYIKCNKKYNIEFYDTHMLLMYDNDGHLIKHINDLKQINDLDKKMKTNTHVNLIFQPVSDMNIVLTNNGSIELELSPKK